MEEFDLTVFRREPTPREAEAAQREIDRQELAIAIIEQRIKKLLSNIQDLRRVQAEHEQVVRKCKGVITLARRIPEELLARIFEQCVADGWSRAPIAVSHVCSAWRRAALAPRVWSRLYVNTESSDVLGRTRYWLAMARHAPLHIAIVATWRTVPSQLADAMVLLGRRAKQWKTLEVESDLLRYAQLVAARCSPDLPMLREVSILTHVHFDQDLDGEESLLLRDAFDAERAPALAEFRLVCNVIPNNLTLPTHITTLSLHLKESPSLRPLSAVAILNLLETLPALEHLTFKMPLLYEHPYIEEPESSRTVTLPALTSLTIYGPTNLNGLLAHLLAPSLIRLHLRSLEDTGYRQDPIGPTLLSFIARSCPPLELLELHDIDLSPEYFDATLGATPYLRSLSLHESAISDATIRLLEPVRTGGAGLCPRLASVDLRWCGQLTGKALVRLVESRRREGQGMPGAFPGRENDYSGGDSDGNGSLVDPIAEIAVLNCCYVQENDVLDLARMTVCRVCLRDDDYCRTCKCCDNTRYRQRLKMRHLTSLSKEERAKLKLII